tara:strand:+ start:50 stop:553 length:504 start_codon:yes stop_codon:yes gene_type:complete
MCDIASALAVTGAVLSYRQKKAENKGIVRDQETTRENAFKGYMHDINKIDQEKVNADREKAKAEFETKNKRDGEIAQKLNLGFGNSTKIIQSIGALYDEDWNHISNEYDKDNQMFKNQRTEAYANMSKTYNSLKPPTEPSRTGLMIDVATAANSGYQRSQTNTGAKK